MKFIITLMFVMMGLFTTDPVFTFTTNYHLVDVTVYHAVEGQTDESPLITADGSKISSSRNAGDHRWIAVSRDLRSEYPYGSKVRIKGTDRDGVYTVRDTMNPRYKSRIDILISLGERLGKWSNVKLYKL